VLASTPAGPLAFNPGSLHCAAASDVQAELAGSLAGDGLDVQTRVLARYDGTLWHTLRFAARPGLQLTDLRIEIPLVPAVLACPLDRHRGLRVGVVRRERRALGHRGARGPHH